MITTLTKLLPLVNTAPESSLLYTGNYDFLLVGFSIAVAIFASYAALLVTRHIAHVDRLALQRLWLAGGALCLGIGIWAMHFIGMLAFTLPCASSYDVTLTLLSTLPGIATSAIALYLISRPRLSTARLLLGGALLGIGIAAMHYSGMAAMRLNGMIRYDTKWFCVSLLVGVVLSSLALWINSRVHMRQTGQRLWITLGSAIILGLAVSATHYTAMASAYFIRNGTVIEAGMSPTFLAAIVMTGAGLIIAVTLIATYIEKADTQPVARAYKFVSVLILAWCFIAWFSAGYYYEHNLSEQYQREAKTAKEQLDDIAHDVTENTKILKGTAHVLAGKGQVLQAMRRFGANALPSALPYSSRKQAWIRDPALARLDATLSDIKKSMDAEMIYLVNAAGDCFASDNTGEDTTIGTNYADRTYFAQVRAGQLGHQYAMGRTTNIPGLFYAHPIFSGGHFLGAAITKRDITRLSDWTNQTDTFVVDINGVIVLARDPRLEFHKLPGAAKLTAARNREQYKREVIAPLALAPWGDKRFPAAMRIGEGGTPVILVSKTLPEDGLTIYTARPFDALTSLGAEQYWLFALLTAAGSMLIISVSAFVLYWRATQRSATDLRLAAIAFESQQGMMITDHNNRILQVNKAFIEISGYSAAEVIGKNPRLLQSHREDQDASFYAEMWRHINQFGVWEGELWNRHKNGEIFPEHLIITAVREPGGAVTNYVATYKDITAAKAAAAKIEQLAFYDPLTELPNRRLLLDRLQHALAAGSHHDSSGALLFIDMDNFKTLNDTLGHDIGDLLLQQAARRLESCVGADDTVARLGGDEFVVLLENLDKDALKAAAQADAVGEQMLITLNRPYHLGHHDYHITSSIGITLFHDHLLSVDTLFKQADIAMYQAKKAGRNTLRFFDAQMQDSVNARASLEIELRKAIAQQQFQLHYQIQVSDAQRVIGAEALIRWHHPERGWVSPMQFIPLAEENGLILSIGHWIVDAACAQLQAWQNDALTRELVLSVNLSARQFRQRDFVSRITTAIEYYAVDARLLKFELTESVVLESVDDAIATMRALNTIGVRFALDDFGTGYSSLQYLKRLPLAQLKIDQSFVRDLDTDSSDQAIVRTVIAMAHSFDMEVIAEGVETEAQRKRLAKKGCTLYQGYLFGKPMPVTQFNELVQTFNARKSSAT